MFFIKSETYISGILRTRFDKDQNLVPPFSDFGPYSNASSSLTNNRVISTRHSCAILEMTTRGHEFGCWLHKVRWNSIVDKYLIRLEW